MAIYNGTNGDDHISGSSGNDQIFGLGGNDWIWGSKGADAIDGGSGIDTVAYYDIFHQDSNVGVWIDLASGSGSRGDAEGDTFVGIENVWGTYANDVIFGDDGANEVHGWFGNDVIKGGGGADDLWGEHGDDVIKGGGGDDILDGGLGIDTLIGGVGDDTYYARSEDTVTESAGEGYDWVYALSDYTLPDNVEGLVIQSLGAVYGIGNALANTIVGNNVANVLDGGSGSDILSGGGGDDILYGGEDGDVLYGEAGADILNGGLGSDDLIGGAGDDVYVADSTDWVFEAAGGGTDIVYSYSVAYTLSDNIEILSLASAGSPGVYGTGNAQSNTIYGNAGDNVLDGGGGSDALSGLGGNDTFVFHAGQANGDVVYEFNGNGAAAGDVLRFEGYGTLAQGATFHQLNATEWQINSADGTIHEVITLVSGAVIDTTVDIMFV